MASSPASSTVESPKASHSGKKPYLCVPPAHELGAFDLSLTIQLSATSLDSGFRGKALHRGILATAGLGFFLFGYVRTSRSAHPEPETAC